MTTAPGVHASDIGLEVLDESDPGDRPRLEGLHGAGILALDDTDRQRAGLIDLLPSVPSALLTESLRWAYFPWRHTMVRVLGPGGFRMLRSDRNRNKITREEQAVLSDQVIGIVGLSVGHAIAHTLALEGLCRELRLADFDRIELSNLNRIPGTVLDLGVNKAVVVARRIAELDPYLTVRVMPGGLVEAEMDGFVDGLDLVIDECDSLDVKVGLRAAARRHRIPLLMETSDRGLLDVERFDLDPDRELFHGLLGATPPSALRGLTTHDKVPHVLRILEAPQLSARMAASMTEVDETVRTWPQLGSDIMLGAASVSTVIRRMGRGERVRSGRVRIDLAEAIDAIADPMSERSESVIRSVDEVGQVDLIDEPEPSWARVSTEDFGGVADPRLRDILHTAQRAPSGGNVQPWSMTIDQRALVIRLDPSRSTRMDVRYRGSLVAIGAALYNARVAAARHELLGGHRTVCGTCLEDTAAVLDLSPGGSSPVAELYRAVHERVSNRHVGTPGAISDAVLVDLRDRAGEFGAGIVTVTDDERMARVGEQLGESDRIRLLTPDLHEEMMGELRWPGEDMSSGLDVRTLELDESDLAKLAVARRADVMAQLGDWDAGRALGEPTRERIAAAGAVVVVTAPDRTPAGWIAAGQAVEAVWIAAERAGLAVQPISPVFLFADDADDFAGLSERYAVDLAELARDFRRVVGLADEPLALVLRLAENPPPSVPSRRRDPAESLNTTVDEAEVA